MLETKDVHVRILLLEGGQATAWHFHTKVVDRMFCLEGDVPVGYQEPGERVELVPEVVSLTVFRGQPRGIPGQSLIISAVDQKAIQCH